MPRIPEIAYLAILVFFIGCNQNFGNSVPSAQKNISPADGATAPVVNSLAHIPANAGPEEIVRHFMESIRTGDEKIAAGLLTALARSATEKHGLAVQPMGSPQARFEVKTAEIVPPGDAAHVPCMWSDADEHGVLQAFNVVWILRRETAGWRVAGMATEYLRGSAPLVLNFENPGEMLAKREAASAEIARREKINEAPTGVAPPSGTIQR